MKNTPEVVMIGLGYIGLPTAALIAGNGTQVHGVDINQQVVDTINAGKIHIVEPSLDVAVANAVKICASKGVDLAELNLTELRLACALSNPDMIGSDVTAVLTLQGSVNSRNHVGGTAPERVLAAIAQARSLLKD